MNPTTATTSSTTTAATTTTTTTTNSSPSSSQRRPRYKLLQQNRTVIHPSLPQPTINDGDDVINELDGSSGDGNQTNINNNSKPSSKSKNSSPSSSSSYSFILCADTQFGMTNDCMEWETEMEYSRLAVQKINSLMMTMTADVGDNNDNIDNIDDGRRQSRRSVSVSRPLLFCCICGDLVHMESSFYQQNQQQQYEYNNNNNKKKTPPTTKKSKYTKEECDQIQKEQFQDFKSIWNELHDDIALICLCGNHGNRPTKDSIETFTNEFGNDYLAFWVNDDVYNIVLNSSLISDSTNAEDLYEEQYQWLQERLEYARNVKHAKLIFIFTHHPWFLYDENEDAKDLHGTSTIVDFHAPDVKIQDGYFHIPKQRRLKYMKIFQQYNVTACFSGHFHQNLISKTSFGMDMIITGPLSVILQSDGIPPSKRRSLSSSSDDLNDDVDEPNTRGIRLVEVNGDGDGSFTHQFLPL